MLPHPREFDHHFLPRGRELDKQIARVAGIRSLKKFPRGCPGGFTLLELTETLIDQFVLPLLNLLWISVKQ